jgi:hypothetical protein
MLDDATELVARLMRERDAAIAERDAAIAERDDAKAESVRARVGYDEACVFPRGFNVCVATRNGQVIVRVELHDSARAETMPLEPHEARQVASLLRGATECDYLPHRSCDEALETARKERDRTIDCGQDPALGCAEAPGCLVCFGRMNGELVEERDEARAEVERLRARFEALHDEVVLEAALDRKGRAYTSACVREWCASRIGAALKEEVEQ